MSFQKTLDIPPEHQSAVSELFTERCVTGVSGGVARVGHFKGVWDGKSQSWVAGR